jgi:hypothetical protein
MSKKIYVNCTQNLGYTILKKHSGRDMYKWVIDIKVVLRERGYKPYKLFESKCVYKHILM